MDRFFKQNSKSILIYPVKERIDDYFEKNVTQTFLNPISVRAIVYQLTEEKLKWKMPRVQTTKACELLIEKNNENIIRLAGKIVIDSETYFGYKDDAGNNISILSVDDNYIKILVYIKN